MNRRFAATLGELTGGRVGLTYGSLGILKVGLKKGHLDDGVSLRVAVAGGCIISRVAVGCLVKRILFGEDMSLEKQIRYLWSHWREGRKKFCMFWEAPVFVGEYLHVLW